MFFCVYVKILKRYCEDDFNIPRGMQQIKFDKGSLESLKKMQKLGPRSFWYAGLKSIPWHWGRLGHQDRSIARKSPHACLYTIYYLFQQMIPRSVFHWEPTPRIAEYNLGVYLIHPALGGRRFINFSLNAFCSTCKKYCMLIVCNDILQ